jgi:hypothetical protein
VVLETFLCLQLRRCLEFHTTQKTRTECLVEELNALLMEPESLLCALAIMILPALMEAWKAPSGLELLAYQLWHIQADGSLLCGNGGSSTFCPAPLSTSGQQPTPVAFSRHDFDPPMQVPLLWLPDFDFRGLPTPQPALSHAPSPVQCSRETGAVPCPHLSDASQQKPPLAQDKQLCPA